MEHQKAPSLRNHLPHRNLSRLGQMEDNMLHERGVQVMNVDVIGKAYDIAASYLRHIGAIREQPAPNEALLQLIVQLFEHGDHHQLSLANRAIMRYQRRAAQQGEAA